MRSLGRLLFVLALLFVSTPSNADDPTPIAGGRLQFGLEPTLRRAREPVEIDPRQAELIASLTRSDVVAACSAGSPPSGEYFWPLSARVDEAGRVEVTAAPARGLLAPSSPEGAPAAERSRARRLLRCVLRAASTISLSAGSRAQFVITLSWSSSASSVEEPPSGDAWGVGGLGR